MTSVVSRWRAALAALFNSVLRDPRSAAGAAGLVGAAVYANSLLNQFAYDDLHIIVTNPLMQDLGNLPRVLEAPYWPGTYGREQGIWRPLTTAVMMILYQVGGQSPLIFHVLNVAGHAIVSAMVVLVGAALVPLPTALVAGLVFAVHPVHVEAVSNVVGMSELISGVAMLGACLVYVRRADRPGWGTPALVALLYGIAFASKESGVTLPALLFLIDAARRRIGFGDLGAYVRQSWRTYAAMAVVAVLFLAGRMRVLGGVASAEVTVGADILREAPRIWTLGEVWLHYVRLWVFPMDLSMDYSPNVLPVSLDWGAANTVGVALAIAVLVGALVAWRRGEMSPSSGTARAAAFGIVWFLIAISPTSNVFFLSGILLAERTLYFPSVGLALGTGWLITRLYRERRRVAMGLLVAILALGSLRTWTRTPVWRNNEAAFTALVGQYPQSGRSQWILGDNFIDNGNHTQALITFRIAANILESHYSFITHVAEVLIGLKRFESAERLLEMAWRDLPDNAMAPSLLAGIRATYGDAVGTELWARRSLEIAPDDPVRRHLLAWAIAAQGRFDEARAERARAEAEAYPVFWHQWAYMAYLRKADGDTAGVAVAMDSAWALASSELDQVALDSIRIADFGLPAIRDSIPADTVPVR